MNQSNYEILKKHEGLFMTFKKVGAVRPTSQELDTLEVIYRNECKMILNRYCGACLGEMMNRLSNEIVRYEREQEANKVVEQPIEQVVEQPKQMEFKFKKKKRNRL